MSDCTRVNINNWTIIMKICEEHKTQIDTDIRKQVTSLRYKISAEEFLQRLLPVTVALDKSYKTTIENSVTI